MFQHPYLYRKGSFSSYPTVLLTARSCYVIQTQYILPSAVLFYLILPLAVLSRYLGSSCLTVPYFSSGPL